MNKISVVFFATPDIAINSFLSLINDENFIVKALVTQPPKPSDRGKKIKDSKIKQEEIKNNIKIFEPEKISKDKETIEELRALKHVFFVTYAYGQILSNEVLEIPKFQTINLHASLLPKYRGANPICECLLNGDKKTGITTMITVLELDAGDICLTKDIELNDDDNFATLTDKISKLSPDLIKKTLLGLYEGKISPVKQNSSLATFTKKLKKSDKDIMFDTSAIMGHNNVSAMCEINTNHFFFNGKIVKVLETKVIENNAALPPGEVIEVNKDGILIKCKNNAILIKKVKPEGKGIMNAYDWSLGSKIKAGDKILCRQEE